MAGLEKQIGRRSATTGHPASMKGGPEAAIHALG